MGDVLRTKSIVCTGSFAAKQYTFVKLDTSGQLATPAEGGYAIGVIQDNPAALRPGSVCSPGDITQVLCGDTFAAGSYVATDSSGRAIPADSGDYYLGIAMTSGAVNKIATILYQPFGTM